jgi:hypothetical protein
LIRAWPENCACVPFPFAFAEGRNLSVSNTSLLDLFAHLIACQTLNVWMHVRSGNNTFFCGTIPGKIRVPEVRSEMPATVERRVDFPALLQYFTELLNK